MNQKAIIEWAPFTIKEGINEETLLKSSADLQQEFLNKQVGFIKRELIKKSDRDYVDIVHWKSKEDAGRAIENAENSPICFAYFQLMAEADHNHPGAGVSIFEVVGEYQND